jgi:hypothetical protein
MLALPPLSVVAPELYVPLVNVTVPVGSAAPAPIPGVTTIVTGSASDVVMVVRDGCTNTVTVTGPTVTWPAPVSGS